MKINVSILNLIFLYLVFGIFVANQDLTAGIIYFILFPFHLYLAWRTLKRNQIMFGLFFCLILFSHGIHSFSFFLFRELYAVAGFNAIGNFDYSLSYFVRAYVYIFVFIIGVYIVSLRSAKENFCTCTEIFKNLYDSLNDKKRGIGRSVKYEYFTVIICILGCFLAVFMYSYSIGITGIAPIRLPFHLTGIIYYFRKYVLVGLILFFYLKSNKRNISFCFVCFYALFAGMAFASKGLAAFVLFPIAMIEVVSKNYKKAILAILYFFFLYDFLTSAKEFLYLSPTINTPFLTYISQIIINYKMEPAHFSLILNNFSGRLFGMQTTVLVYQHANGTFNDLISFYMGESIGSIIPNMASTMFGLHFNSSYNFGVAIGYVASALYLSGHSLILMFLQGLLFGWILSIHERCINRCLLTKKSKFKIWIIIGVSLFGLSSVWLNTSLILLYVSTLINLYLSKFGIPILKIRKRRLYV